MNTKRVLFTALAAVFGFVTVEARGAVDVSVNFQIGATADFYEPLTPLGSWVEVGSYGRCWHPRSITADWRPYSEGHWEWTDVGWYWVSDEPWSWACYHYGSWIQDPNYGWIWIPGTEWAPSWVVWRESPDYIGWAPCGPRGVVLEPAFFVFVDIHNFHRPIHRRDLVVNNTTIINRTRVINDIRHEDRDFGGRRQRIAVNRGPGVDPIQRATGTQFTARPVTEVVSQTPMPESVRRRQLSDGKEPPREQPRETLPPTGRQQPSINNNQPQTGPDRERRNQAQPGGTDRQSQSSPVTQEKKTQSSPPTNQNPRPSSPDQRPDRGGNNDLRTPTPAPESKPKPLPPPTPLPRRSQPDSSGTPPPERPLPATGRPDEGAPPGRSPRVPSGPGMASPAQRPPAGATPVAPQETPSHQERGQDKEKDKSKD